VDAGSRAGLGAVTLRPQALIGPGDLALFVRLLKLARSGWLPILGDGRTRIDLTYVDNVVDAIELASVAPPAALAKKYNITNDEPVSLYETFEHLLKELSIPVKKLRIPFRPALVAAAALERGYQRLAMGKPPPLNRYAVCLLGRTRTLNIERART